MTEDKKGFSLTEKIVVPVVVALLVGGTSPWWWNALVARKPAVKPDNSPAQTTPSISPPAGEQAGGAATQKPQEDTPASLSRTRYSLVGDEITFFRVASRNGRQLMLEVDYKYNEQHGNRVMAGAWLKGISSGYKPVAFVPSPGQGTVQVEVNVSEAGYSTGIDIFLYEYGKAGELFARRTFPFQNSFK